MALNVHRATLSSPRVAASSCVRPAVRGVVQPLRSSNVPGEVSSSVVVFSSHPDALKRRQEAEAQRQAREAQRSLQADGGHAWWNMDMPENMSLALVPGQLKHMIRMANKAKRLVLVKYFSEDCYGCKSMTPKLRQIAEANPDITFLKVNAGEDVWRNFCEEQGLTKIPFFQLYKDEQLVSQFTANMQPEKLKLLRGELAAHSKGSPVAV